ncbi:hypothetical protein KAI04_04605 [Candidatus Pacearchaeota archaeon]|nr:hypothetical protein [Candidatus Pacearchaeota archaeon]
MGKKTKEEKAEEPKIFLVENNLFNWEKPLKPGYMRSGMAYNAKTELLESLGMDIVNENIKGYNIQATAAKYLAKVIRLGKDKYRDPSDEIKGTPEDLILFNGNIAIYLAGEIPGTKLKGFDLENTGRIWLATTPTDILKSDKGLHNLILGNELTEEGKVERIKAILRGYEQMESEEEIKQSNREHQAWKSGVSQANEGHFGTFGRR